MEENTTNNTTATEETGAVDTKETVKTYTQEEVDKLLQSEADKRVASALKKREKDFAKQMAEAEKLRTMDAEQRRDYEFEKEKERFEAERKEFAIMRNKIEATKILGERGLPVAFCDYVVGEDAEEILDKINALERVFNDAVNETVKKRISEHSGSPKAPAIKQAGMTKEEFNKLSLAQRNEIFNTNPTLYRQMTGH